MEDRLRQPRRSRRQHGSPSENPPSGQVRDRRLADPRPSEPREALRHFAAQLAPDSPVTPIADGLVNRTWAIGRPARFALQEVAAQFGDDVNRHILAVSGTLVEAGLAAPRLQPTDDGRLSVPGLAGRRWRLLAWIDGANWHRVPSPGHAQRAAGLLARFHDALYDAAAGRALPESHFHDTAGRMRALEAALERSGGSQTQAGEDPARLGETVLEQWRLWREATPAPPPARPGHGDLKISNVLFDPADGRAVGLIDFDTLGLHGLDAEFGDALRSWCNPQGEDTAHPRLDVEIFRASVQGYLARSRTVTAEERECLVAGFGRIALELAARFLTDVVEDRYFAWDPAVAPSRRAHNLLRAEGQLALAGLIAARRGELEAIAAATIADD